MSMPSMRNFLLSKTTRKRFPAVVAIVGRSEPKTGGEFYNKHALQALEYELGKPSILELADLPLWVRILYPKLKILFYLFGNVWFSVKLIRKKPICCYIDYYMYPFMWLSKLVAYFSAIKLLVVVHDLYHVILNNGAKKKLQIFLQRAFLMGCDQLVVTSRDTSIRLQKDLGVPDSRIKIIYPGIEVMENESVGFCNSRQEGKINILYVGMIKMEKRVLDLVKAVKRIMSDGFNLTLHLAGRADIEPDYTMLVQQEAVKGGVQLIIHGFLPKKDLNKLFCNSDIFVLPSLYETFGMVAVEAMSFGLPVICTNVGGIPEFITHGENGLLFKPGDVEDLVKNLRYLCRSSSSRERIGRQARKVVQTLPSWEDTRKGFQSIVRQENISYKIKKKF